MSQVLRAEGLFGLEWLPARIAGAPCIRTHSRRGRHHLSFYRRKRVLRPHCVFDGFERGAFSVSVAGGSRRKAVALKSDLTRLEGGDADALIGNRRRAGAGVQCG